MSTGTIVLIGMYFLPFLIAVLRRHRNSAAIGATNLLLGWTVLGWIIAFIWSLTSPNTVVIHAVDPPRERPQDRSHAWPRNWPRHH